MGRAALVLVLLLSGCGAGAAAPDGLPAQSCETRTTIIVDVPAVLDLLFVIDDSVSMQGEQSNLRANYRAWFAYGFERLILMPSLHIAVASADAAAGGRFRSGTFLADIARPDGSRERNYAGTLSDAFAGLADLGASNAGATEPLAAMQLALDGSHADGAGFLRPGAYLGVVLVTDEHDGSSGAEPEDYARFLTSVAPDAGRVLVSGVFGPPSPAGAPSCSTAYGEAAPGIRLQRFLDQFPGRATFVSICEEDLTDAVLPFVELGRLYDDPRCLDGFVDETDCSVVDTRREGTDQEEATPLPRCGPGVPRPCWRLVDDPSCAHTETRLAVVVDRDDWPPDGTSVVARCALTRC